MKGHIVKMTFLDLGSGARFTLLPRAEYSGAIQKSGKGNGQTGSNGNRITSPDFTPRK